MELEVLVFEVLMQENCQTDRTILIFTAFACRARNLKVIPSIKIGISLSVTSTFA